MPFSPAPLRRHTACCAFLLLLAILSVAAHGQALPVSFNEESGTTSAPVNGAGPTGIVPLTHGFNASLGTSSQHDSSNGWSSVLTPGVAYRFNRLFSVSAGIPIYAYINVDETKGTGTRPVYVQSTQHGVPGDTTIAGEFIAMGRIVDYSATLSLGLPSGSTAYGLGAGQPTYDINNHFEKGFGIFTPDVELGMGNSNTLVGARIKKNYTAVGTVAHFQCGASVDLPFNMSFEADAYEQLPLAASTLYSTTGKGKKKVTTAIGKSIAEDNGFITSLDIPLDGHLTLSGFYNRSLRSSDDVAGFSFTFLLKAPSRPDQTPY